MYDAAHLGDQSGDSMAQSNGKPGGGKGSAPKTPPAQLVDANYQDVSLVKQLLENSDYRFPPAVWEFLPQFLLGVMTGIEFQADGSKKPRKWSQTSVLRATNALIKLTQIKANAGARAYSLAKDNPDEDNGQWTGSPDEARLAAILERLGDDPSTIFTPQALPSGSGEGDGGQEPGATNGSGDVSS